MILNLSSHHRSIKDKMDVLKDWSRCGKATTKAGCLLLGYEAFRMLVFFHTQKKPMQNYTTNELNVIEKCVYDCVLKRGATDLVICDEGHMIKNQKSTTSLAVNKIETDRRIILTGTPIQNNLKECKLNAFQPIAVPFHLIVSSVSRLQITVW